MFFETDKRLGHGRAPCLWIFTTRRIRCTYFWSGRRAWNFSHRHAVVKVEESEEEVTLIDSLEGSKGKFNIYNSLLSEYGVLF
jgi:2-oxoglutarate dehydrogenase E1 component